MCNGFNLTRSKSSRRNLQSREATDLLETPRIDLTHGICPRIQIRIHSARQPDGVGLQIPAEIGHIVAVEVVMEAGLAVIFLARQAQAVGDGGSGHPALSEGLVGRRPDLRLAAVE